MLIELGNPGQPRPAVALEHTPPIRRIVLASGARLHRGVERALAMSGNTEETRPSRALRSRLESLGSKAIQATALPRQIVWGWKRDSEDGRLSRAVYFSAEIEVTESQLHLRDYFLRYVHRGPREELSQLTAVVHGMQRGTELPIRAGVDGLDAGCRLTLELGHTRVADEDRFARLVERTRGVSGPTPPRVPSVGPAQLDEALGATFDLLAGSGLSYESGVPMLKWVHDLFRVDDGDRGFCLGSADRFPIDLSEDLEATVASFATWQLLAGAASPSPAHRAILDLRRSGRLDRIFTDNVDRLLPACGVEDSVNVRGSGVVNEVFPAHFGSNSRALLVVGVSADRRGVIAQARRRGMRIVVVNPYLPVSPGARNLDYLQSGDVYGRATAGELLPKLSR